MATCKRCGRCYEHETTNAIDRMSMKDYRYDNLEMRAVIPVSTEHLELRSPGKDREIRTTR